MIIKSPLRSSENKQTKAIQQLETEVKILDGPLKNAIGVRQLVDKIIIESGSRENIQVGAFEYFETDLHKFHITQRRHLSRSEIKSLSRQILQALYATHKSGIVHTG